MLEQQHKIRGLIAAFKSRGFVKNEASTRSSRYRSGLHRILLGARVAILPAEFEAFLFWVAKAQSEQLPELDTFPIGYEELSGVAPTTPIAPLDRELLWVAARIRVASEELSKFRSSVQRAEQYVCQQEYQNAIDVLEQIEHSFGASLWSVQLRIAIEQQAGGLERQKKYTAAVRRIYRRGLLSFVAFHTSTRNEGRTTLAKYVEEVRVRIDGHSYFDDSLKIYARYRLAGEWPSTNTGFADVLRIEQSHSILDVYETFIAAVQELIRRGVDKRERHLLLRCLDSAAHVRDFRVEKARAALDGRFFSTLPHRQREISDALLSGKLAHSVLRARKAYREGDTDIWQHVYAGFALASTKVATRARFSRRFDFANLSTIFSPSDLNDGSGILSKLALNLSGLPLGKGFMEVLAQVRPSHPTAHWRPWLIGLNSPTLGIEDCYSSECLAILDSEVESSTKDAWKSLWDHRQNSSTASECATSLLGAAGQIREANFHDARKMLEPLRKLNSEPVRYLATINLLHAYFACGAKQDLISLIADEGVKSDAHFRALPIVASLKGCTWADYKLVPDGLSAAIALHLQWRADENAATQSLVRFATGHFLRSCGVPRPSLLVDQKQRYPHHLLVYFLWDVCVPQVLDTSRVLKSSREVMDERLAICSALKRLDPPNSSMFEAEVIDIANIRTLEEGRWVVNSARIHVDTEALFRWATRELAEDYARYTDLLSIRSVPSQAFDDVLQEILSSSQMSDAYTPEDEADAVFMNIVQRLRDEFLNNPSFGLDFYLSKRIRHQSFIGLIRGPLEFAQLITTRETETGRYRRNDFWLSKFSQLSEAQRDSVSEVFGQFSANFDDLLAEAKDTQFQVRSNEKPSGVISLELTASFYLLLRSVATIDVELHEFVPSAVALLWAALDPSLARARQFVAESLKTSVAEAFDELRARVRGIADGDPALLEFGMEVASRSTEVQNALDEAAAWFTHLDTELAKQHYTLSEIAEIAVDAALKCHRPFHPQIKTNIESGDLSMDATTLIFVHDVLFVGIGNARVHSGTENPEIVINIRPDPIKGIVSIEVLCGGRPRQRDAKERRMQEIRALIAAGNVGRRARAEGGSGFLKLAAVVNQSSKGKLEFGFIETGEFRLRVDYSLILPKKA